MNERRVEAVLGNLTLAQKVGQMLMVGFPHRRLTPDLAGILTRCHVGGTILFGHNVDSPWQASRLTADLQAMAARNGEPTLLIAADQEGGLVSRLKYPATAVPSAMAIAATGRPENAALCAGIIAAEMKSLGLNCNFAPVADVNTNPFNPIIGTRAYGDNTELVARMAVAAIRAHQQHGVLPMAKHFPGHGDTRLDSHLDLPVCEHSWERLQNVELRPFQAAIEAGVDMIVTSHVAFTKCDPTGMPTTMSRALLTDYLRTRMGFQGVIVSDALVMDAINRRYGMAVGAVTAVRAGVDLVLPLGTLAEQEKVYEALLRAARIGALPAERIDSAVRRILKAKFKVAGTRDDRLDEERWPKPEHRRIVERVMREAITVVKDDLGFLPLALEPQQRLAVVDFQTAELRAVQERNNTPILEVIIRSRHKNADVIVTDCSSPHAERLVLETCVQSDFVILFTRNAFLAPEQARIARLALQLNRPTIVVALQSPYDLLAVPDAPCYIAAYDDQQAALEAVAGVLYGDFEACGQLPVHMNGALVAEAVVGSPA